MAEETKKRVVVVGAGVIGASIAFELQRRGLAVTLVDKGEPGRGTSFGNMASIALDFVAGSGPSTWKKMPGWLLDPEGPVWLRPSYAAKMLPWFLRFLAAGRPSRLRAIEDAGMSLSQRALGDFRQMLGAIGAPELMTEEGCLAIYETEAEFAADRGHLAMSKAGNPALVESAQALVLGQRQLVNCLGRPVGAAMGANEFRHQRQDRDAAGNGDAAVLDQEVVARRECLARKGDLEILGMEGMNRGFAPGQQTFLGEYEDAGADADHRDSGGCGDPKVVAMLAGCRA